MKELIKITTNSKGIQTISARDLHQFLEVTERFSSWINRQFQYGFDENKDYVGCKVFNTLANQELTDYALTLDTAKEISMIQKSEKGKEARQYFIEKEKELRGITNTFKVPTSFREALLLAAEQQEVIEKQQLQLKEQEPQVLFAKALEVSDQNILIGQLAKLLNQNGINIGQNRLFTILRETGYLHKSGEQYNMPTQRSMDLGLFKVKTTTINNPDGSVRVTKTPKVTGKGQSYFVNKFIKK